MGSISRYWRRTSCSHPQCPYIRLRRPTICWSPAGAFSIVTDAVPQTGDTPRPHPCIASTSKHEFHLGRDLGLADTAHLINKVNGEWMQHRQQDFFHAAPAAYGSILDLSRNLRGCEGDPSWPLACTWSLEPQVFGTKRVATYPKYIGEHSPERLCHSPIYAAWAGVVKGVFPPVD